MIFVDLDIAPNSQSISARVARGRYSGTEFYELLSEAGIDVADGRNGRADPRPEIVRAVNEYCAGVIAEKLTKNPNATLNGHELIRLSLEARSCRPNSWIIDPEYR